MGSGISAPAEGLDSIDSGRAIVNRAHIYIDKRRCPNTYKEFVTYEYDRNKDGQFISAYPDANNHSIDAVRYGLSEIMNRDKIVSRRVNF